MDTNNLTMKEVALMSAFAIGGTAFLVSGMPGALWATLSGPFDQRPESPGFLDIIKNPQLGEEYRRDLCAWTRREYVRNPTERVRLAKVTVCKER